MEAFVAEIKKIPPVTRFSVVSLIGLTTPVMLKMLNPEKLVYFGTWVWKGFQLWRLPTSFFFGSTNINFIFEVSMLYRTMNQLESSTFSNNSSDLAWQLFIASGSIILATRPLRSILFLHPLLACLAYVSSALAPPGAQTSIMGLLTIPVTYFPYVMVGMDLLSGGPYAAAQAVAGIIVGHLWWWAVWGGELGGAGIAAQVRWSEAPKWLRDWFGEVERGRGTGGPSGVRAGGGGGAAEGLRASGIEVVPPRRVAQARDEGHNWGSGQRLGT